MSERIPCPLCGTESEPGDMGCRVCGFGLAGAQGPEQDSGKCARCGSALGSGFEFCQVCGLRVQSRYPRPPTGRLRVVPLAVSDERTQEPEPDAAQPHSRTGKTDPSPTARPRGGFHDAGHMSFRPAESAAEAEGFAVDPYATAQQRYQARGHHEVTHEYPPPAQAGPLQSSIYEAGIVPNHAFDDGRETPPEPYHAYDPQFVNQSSARARSHSDPLEQTLEYPPPASQPSKPDVHIPGLVSGGWQRAEQEVRLVLVQRDGSDGEAFTLTGPTVTIGRFSGDLRFPDDEFLGSEHARIQRSEHGLTVHDLESVNGVFLRISAPEPVYPGDVFLLGHQLLRLENVPESGRERPPRSDGVRMFGTPLPPSWGRLVLLGYGGCEAESYFLRPRQVVFGREIGDILFPTDAFISRRHATLTMELQGDSMSVMLEDLQSANGTYLRVRGSAHVEDGDMFRVGDQIFRVRIR